MRVELQGIAVHAAGREILHNINLLIEPGEVLAIAGPGLTPVFRSGCF